METLEIVSAKDSQKCGRDLRSIEAAAVEERKKIDIIYEIVEHSVQSEVKECPECGHKNKGLFSEGVMVSFNMILVLKRASSTS